MSVSLRGICRTLHAALRRGAPQRDPARATGRGQIASRHRISASPPLRPAIAPTSRPPQTWWPTSSRRTSRARPATRCAPTRARRCWWSTNSATCPSTRRRRTGSFRWSAGATRRRPIVLTSNRGFGDWNQVFADPVVASAIVDRLAPQRHRHQHQGSQLSHASLRRCAAGQGRSAMVA